MSEIWAPSFAELTSTSQSVGILRVFHFHDVVDSDNRILNEIQGDRDLLKKAEQHGVPMLEVPYPRTDSESRAPSGVSVEPQRANMSALRQLVDHYPQVLGNILSLRSIVVRGENRRLSVVNAKILATLATALPFYLLWRYPDPVENGQLPGSIAAAHKAAFGLLTAIESFEQKNGNIDFTGTQLLAHAEEKKLLIGPFNVCPASGRMIEQFTELLIEGTTTVQPDSSEFDDLRVDTDRLIGVARIYADYSPAFNTFKTVDKITANELIDILSGTSEMNDTDRAHRLNDLLLELVQAEDAFIEQANSHQLSLDGVLGRGRLRRLTTGKDLPRYFTTYSVLAHFKNEVQNLLSLIS